MVQNQRKAAYYWLFLIPFIATLVPSLYSKATPALGGFPFFYWYLILWIILVGVISGAIYFLSEPRE